MFILVCKGEYMTRLFIFMLILITYLIEMGLSNLNYQNRTQPLPDNVKDIYDEPQYQKWLQYTMDNHRFSMRVKTMNTLFLLVLLFSNFFLWLDQFISSFTTDSIFSTLFFLGIYSFIFTLLNIPFGYYRRFVIEERYGFNTTTIKTYIMDQLKSMALVIVLGGGLLSVLLALYLTFGLGFVLYGWLLLVSVMLMINILYTKVFIRLFNKLTPLSDSELKNQIESFALKTDFEIKKISVMNASKRSTKLNAFFSGFGKFKHIVLFDTLIEKCDPDQIVAVLAHEIGHAKHKDTLRNFVISGVSLAGYLGLLTLFLTTSTFNIAFSLPQQHLGFALVLFSILMEPLDLLFTIPLSAISRWAEYRADQYARKHGYGEALIRALKVLAKENFSNLTPHPWVVKMTYSHPPVSARIDALRQ